LVCATLRVAIETNKAPPLEKKQSFGGKPLAGGQKWRQVLKGKSVTGNSKKRLRFNRNRPPLPTACRVLGEKKTVGEKRDQKQTAEVRGVGKERKLPFLCSVKGTTRGKFVKSNPKKQPKKLKNSFDPPGSPGGRTSKEERENQVSWTREDACLQKKIRKVRRNQEGGQDTPARPGCQGVMGKVNRETSGGMIYPLAAKSEVSK